MSERRGGGDKRGTRRRRRALRLLRLRYAVIFFLLRLPHSPPRAFTSFPPFLPSLPRVKCISHLHLPHHLCRFPSQKTSLFCFVSRSPNAAPAHRSQAEEIGRNRPSRENISAPRHTPEDENVVVTGKGIKGTTRAR